MRPWGEGREEDEDDTYEHPTDVLPPDDPRHGSRAGYYLHLRLKQEACAACQRWADNH